MSSFVARFILLTAVLLAGGCTTVRREVVVPPSHPASPDAVEAPLPPESATLAVQPAAAPNATPAGASSSRHQRHAPADGDSPDPGSVR